MSKKTNLKKEKTPLSNKSSVNTYKFDVGIKVGILHTIARAIYPSTARKIREAVANAIDNEASWMIIFADRSTKTLSLFDNGSGITQIRFKEIFKNLGYGLMKYEEGKLSYFGLGLMSIFQLGDYIKIFTKPSGKKYINALEVDAKEIFNEKNESKPISFLNNHIHLYTKNELNRTASPAPILDEHIKRLFGAMPENYTEIVVENVNDYDFDEICANEFVDELRKLLPLKAEKDEPFLKRFTDPGTEKKLKEILQNSNFCPTIDLYFGIEEETEIRQLWKYFPELKRELEFGAVDVSVDKSKKEGFAYYIVHTTEDLEREEKKGAETGFWIRNRNFLVKSADFFERPGARKKYVHEPLKNWMFGEIFHKDMNVFLSVARDEYLWDSLEFVEFRDEIVGTVQYLNQHLRKCWQEKKRIIDSLIEPFKRFADSNGPLGRTESLLRTMLEVGEDKTNFQQDILERLNKKRRIEIEKDAHRIDILLKSAKHPITLANDKNSLVEIDPNLEVGKDYHATWNPEKDQVKISISPILFSPQKILFLGKAFDVFFVAERENAPGISIDTEKLKVYVNPFNHNLEDYSISFIDIYIALEIADALALNKEEMKHYFLRLLGREFIGVAKYLTPLRDDLMRRQRSR